MDALIFPCEQCGSKLRIPAVHTGKWVRCPKCGHVQAGSQPAQQAPGGTDDLAAFLATASGSQPELAPGDTARAVKPPQGAGRSRTMWIAIGVGGGVAVLAIGLALFLLWPRSEPPAAPAQPSPATQAQSSPQQPSAQPTPPPQPEPAKPPQVSLGWYARYLPAEPALLVTLRVGKVLNSPVFRQATAPISPLVQTLLLQAQQALKMPVTAIDEAVVAVSAPESGGPHQAGNPQGGAPLDFVVAMRTSVPINPQAIFAESKTEQIAGQTVYIRVPPRGGQGNPQEGNAHGGAGSDNLGPEGAANATQQAPPGGLPAGLPLQLQGPEAFGQQAVEVAAWLPDEKMLVLGGRDVITKLIERSSEVSVGPTEDLALALSEVDPPEQSDLLLAASSDIFRLLGPLAGGLGGANPALPFQGAPGAGQPARPSPNPQQPPGSPAPPSVPGGPVGPPGAFGPRGFGPGGGAPLPLPTRGALAISAKAGSDLTVRVAIVSQDNTAAGQTQMQVSSLQQMLMGQVQSTLQQLQQRAGQQGQKSAQGQPGAGNPLQQQALEKQIRGFEKLRDALQQAAIGGHDRLTTIRVTIPGEALAALVLYAMQQQQQQQQQQQGQQLPPSTPGFGPPGFPGAPPGQPGIGPSRR